MMRATISAVIVDSFGDSDSEDTLRKEIENALHEVGYDVESCTIEIEAE